LPYFSAAITIIAFRFLFMGFDKSTLTEDVVKFVLQRRYTALWFLAALFLGSILFCLICRVLNDNISQILLATSFLSSLFVLYDTIIAIPLPWNVDTAIIIQFYLAVGYYLKKKNIFEKIINLKIIPKLLLIVGTSLLACGLTYINYSLCGETYEMYHSQYGIFPITMLAAVLMSLAVIFLSMLAYRCRALIHLGRNSMTYFLFHQSIAIPLVDSILSKYFLIKSSVLQFFIYLIFVLIICSLFDYLIRHTALCYLFGKRRIELTRRID